MGEIAAAAGTSKSVFYRYFGDKDGLRQAVGEVVIGQMRAEVLAAGRSAASAEEGLRAMVSSYLRMAETSPNVYFFVTADREAGSGPAAQAHGQVLDAFFDEVLAMMREGMHAYLASRSTAPGSTPRDGATAVAYWPRASLGMVRAVGEAWLRQQPGPDRPAAEDLTDTVTGWLVHGIAGSLPQESAERHTK
jgi:AcrR family transcriptional regulator